MTAHILTTGQQSCFCLVLLRTNCRIFGPERHEEKYSSVHFADTAPHRGQNRPRSGRNERNPHSHRRKCAHSISTSPSPVIASALVQVLPTTEQSKLPLGDDVPYARGVFTVQLCTCSTYHPVSTERCKNEQDSEHFNSITSTQT